MSVCACVFNALDGFLFLLLMLCRLELMDFNWISMCVCQLCGYVWSCAFLGLSLMRPMYYDFPFSSMAYAAKSNGIAFFSFILCSGLPVVDLICGLCECDFFFS